MGANLLKSGDVSSLIGLVLLGDMFFLNLAINLTGSFYQVKEMQFAWLEICNSKCALHQIMFGD